mmetsp:Transcript_26178/g.65449  ORF Transcript_26178/g.65449 Transcript_26178/m.65449 type:complete len:279 (+) Transcript_26178:1303-2139(+)
MVRKLGSFCRRQELFERLRVVVDGSQSAQREVVFDELNEAVSFGTQQASLVLPLGIAHNLRLPNRGLGDLFRLIFKTSCCHEHDSQVRLRDVKREVPYAESRERHKCVGIRRQLQLLLTNRVRPLLQVVFREAFRGFGPRQNLTLRRKPQIPLVLLLRSLGAPVLRRLPVQSKRELEGPPADDERPARSRVNGSLGGFRGFEANECSATGLTRRRIDDQHALLDSTVLFQNGAQLACGGLEEQVANKHGPLEFVRGALPRLLLLELVFLCLIRGGLGL